MLSVPCPAWYLRPLPATSSVLPGPIWATHLWNCHLASLCPESAQTPVTRPALAHVCTARWHRGRRAVRCPTRSAVAGPRGAFPSPPPPQASAQAVHSRGLFTSRRKGAPPSHTYPGETFTQLLLPSRGRRVPAILSGVSAAK